MRLLALAALLLPRAAQADLPPKGWVKLGERAEGNLGVYACQDRSLSAVGTRFGCWWLYWSIVEMGTGVGVYTKVPTLLTQCPPDLKLESLEMPSVLLSCPKEE